MGESFRSKKEFELDKWCTLVVVITKTEMSMYIDGKLIGTRNHKPFVTNRGLYFNFGNFKIELT